MARKIKYKSITRDAYTIIAGYDSDFNIVDVDELSIDVPQEIQAEEDLVMKKGEDLQTFIKRNICKFQTVDGNLERFISEEIQLWELEDEERYGK